MPFRNPKTNEYYDTFCQAYTAFSESMHLPTDPNGRPYFPVTVGEVEKAIDYMGYEYISLSPMRLVDILTEEKVCVRSITTGQCYEYAVNPDKMRLEAEGKYIKLDDFYEKCLAVFPIDM